MGNKPIKQHLENAQRTGVLQLENFSLKELPAKILEARQQLRTLNFSGNHLEQLPSFIGQFQSLKYLNFDRNRLDYIPDEIGTLRKLENLSLSENRLVSIPTTLMELRNLKSINLSGNRLTEFPLQLCRLPNLDILDLSGNRLKNATDSDELQQLSVIELNLNRNQLNSISAKLARCRRLKVLRVEENCLQVDEFKRDEEAILRSSQISLLAVNGNLFDLNQLRSLGGYENYMQRYTETKKKMG